MAEPPADPGSTKREYVLGTHGAELDRLGFQHRLWSNMAHDLWTRANIAPGGHVLDAGCGPGYAAIDLARLVRSAGRVLGVDESEPYVRHLNERAAAQGLGHLSGVVGDVRDLAGAGVEPGTFDMAWCRWVLCFVDDPAAVVQGIARALRPGGRLVVQDYFNYPAMTLAPRTAAFDEVITAIARSWKDRGGNPDIMGVMPQLCREAGLEVTAILGNPTPVASPGSTLWHWPDSFWPVFLPRLREMGYITSEQQFAFEKAWKHASRSRDSFVLLPPIVGLVATKAEQRSVSGD